MIDGLTCGSRVFAAAVFSALALSATTAPGAEAVAPSKRAQPVPTVAKDIVQSVPCVWRRFDPEHAGGVTYFQDCADTPQMVSFKGGAFNMGDMLGNGLPYEQPVHEVRIKPYAIGRYEVTAAQWQACIGAQACSALPDSAMANTRLPVTRVTWLQAQEYVTWLSRRTHKSYRLPSEAEWEYAARATGKSDQFTWGNNSDYACEHANSFDQSGQRTQPLWSWQIECDDGYPETAPVGSYPANAWGLHDMLGNVWEWVQDCWHSDYTGAPTDGSARTSGDCTKRVNRGGGWGNHPRSLRVSNRDGDAADARSDGLGFRVARDVAEAVN